jgi:hypothetical protein
MGAHNHCDSEPDNGQHIKYREREVLEQPKTEVKHLGASGASADRALRGSALSRSGLSTPGRAVPPLRGCFAPLQSLAHEPGAAFAERVAVALQPLMPRFFVLAGSGARHRADPCKTEINEAVRRATWYPVARSACRFGRIPCARTDRLNKTCYSSYFTAKTQFHLTKKCGFAIILSSILFFLRAPPPHHFYKGRVVTVMIVY